MNSKCFLIDHSNFKRKFIATSLLAVFGTGAFSSYAGATGIAIKSSIDSTDYDKIKIDKWKVCKKNFTEKLSEGLHNYDPNDENDVALRSWINRQYCEVLDIFPEVSEIVQEALNLSREQFRSLEERGSVPKKEDFVFNYLKNESFRKKTVRLGMCSEGIDFVKSSVKNVDSFKKNAKSVIGRFFWDLNIEVELCKLKEWIEENEEIVKEAFPDMGEVVKETFKLNDSQLDCLKRNNLIPERNVFVFYFLNEGFYLDAIRDLSKELIVKNLKSRMFDGDLPEVSFNWMAITKIFNETGKNEDVSIKDNDWIRNLYLLSGKVLDYDLAYGDDRYLRLWVGKNLVELYSMFPDMDDILKDSLGLNEDKINKLKRDQKFPSKVEFIFCYLKQIGFEVSHLRIVVNGKDINYVRSCIKKSEEFNNTAKVVLSKISPSLRG